MLRGIDISEWQGTVDFNKIVKDNVQFAIFRQGCGTRVDYKFFEYVTQAKKAKLPIQGVYHFCYSTNVQEVLAEAKACIKNVQEAKLDKKKTTIFFDFEYDTVTKARAKGVNLTKAECIQFTQAFCQYVQLQGYRAGIYANLDYYKNWYNPATIKKYIFWLAQYNTNTSASIDCLYKQYTSKGKVSGIDGNVDMNYYYDNNQQEQKNTEITAQSVISVMQSWIGKSRSAGTHHDIIDLYNSHLPLARGYAVTYSDDYCDTTVSAAFIKLNAVDLIGGTECGVEEHVKLFKKKGIWQEDGTVTPAPGWIIVYSWRTSTQPNDSYSDHIGIVEAVNGKTITCIEGNMSGGVVGRRTIQVGNGNIRGYAIPQYGEGSNIITPTPAPIQEDNLPLKATSKTKFTVSKATAPNKNPKFVGKVVADFLSVRTWAGTENNMIKSWPQLAETNLIDVCDSIQDSNGDTWYYIRIAGKYYGFSMAIYIQKV